MNITFFFKEDEYHYYLDNNLICQNNLLTCLYDTWWSFNGVLDFVSHAGMLYKKQKYTHVYYFVSCVFVICTCLH